MKSGLDRRSVRRPAGDTHGFYNMAQGHEPTAEYGVSVLQARQDGYKGSEFLHR